MKKNFKENKKKVSLANVAVIIICAVLASSAALAGLGFMSKGFTNTDVGSWFERELNPDNLILKEDYNKKLPERLDNGLNLNWKDDGSIVLTGKVEDKTINAEQDPAPISFTTVELEGGKVYNIYNDNEKSSEKTFGLQATYLIDGEMLVENVGNAPLVIDLTDVSGIVSVDLAIFYENNVTYFGINSYIRPVVVVDGAASGFYK